MPNTPQCRCIEAMVDLVRQTPLVHAVACDGVSLFSSNSRCSSAAPGVSKCQFPFFRIRLCKTNYGCGCWSSVIFGARFVSVEGTGHRVGDECRQGRTKCAFDVAGVKRVVVSKVYGCACTPGVQYVLNSQAWRTCYSCQADGKQPWNGKILPKIAAATCICAELSGIQHDG